MQYRCTRMVQMRLTKAPLRAYRTKTKNSSIDPGEAVVEPIGDADVGSTSVTEEIAEGDTTGVDMDPLPVDSMLEDIKAISSDIAEKQSHLEELGEDAADTEEGKGSWLTSRC